MSEFSELLLMEFRKTGRHFHTPSTSSTDKYVLKYKYYTCNPDNNAMLFYYIV